MGPDIQPKGPERDLGRQLCQRASSLPAGRGGSSPVPTWDPTARSSDTLAKSGSVFKCFINYVASTLNTKELVGDVVTHQ